jgi:hypothetical protein
MAGRSLGLLVEIALSSQFIRAHCIKRAGKSEASSCRAIKTKLRHLAGRPPEAAAQCAKGWTVS